MFDDDSKKYYYFYVIAAVPGALRRYVGMTESLDKRLATHANNPKAWIGPRFKLLRWDSKLCTLKDALVEEAVLATEEWRTAAGDGRDYDSVRGGLFPGAQLWNREEKEITSRIRSLDASADKLRAELVELQQKKDRDVSGERCL